MPTTGVINGTLLRLYIGGSAVAYATSCTLSMNTELRETIHKDNPGSGNREIETGQKSGSISFDALYSSDGAANAPDDLFTTWDNRTSISWIISTEVAGDVKYTGSGYITSLELNAPVEENSTISGTIEIDGSITKATIT